MNQLLDRFTIPKVTIRPTTPAELFAFRLALKLRDAAAARHYLDLGEQYSQAQMLLAFRRTMRHGSGKDLGRQFHRELDRVTSSSYFDQQTRLISVRVERRTIAAAIFTGDHLEYTDSRQLSSSPEKALTSAVGFTNWLMQHFSVESSTLEAIPKGNAFQRRSLHDAIYRTLRDRMIPIWEVPKTDLLEGFGYPALGSRRELREIATTIWPVISGNRAGVFIQDAAILGLHVQTERLLIIN
jgi:hypothetical protein